MPSPAKQVFFADYFFSVPENVYEPAEDTFLFAENLAVERGDLVLDAGTGCGVLGIIAAAKAAHVVAVDISPYAIRCAKENAKLNHVIDKLFFVRGDLFEPLRVDETFDLILFNAPYLPTEETEGASWLERAWAGGATGRQIIDRFVRQSLSHLKAGGRVLLLQSTLSDVDWSLKVFEEEGLRTRIIASRDLPFFESIALIEARRL
jgi:release factor glutamine methyltransferase